MAATDSMGAGDTSGPIAVYGATGFTGGLIARELKRREASFLIAGRDRRRLDRLSEVLGEVPMRAAAADDASGPRRRSSLPWPTSASRPRSSPFPAQPTADQGPRAPIGITCTPSSLT